MVAYQSRYRLGELPQWVVCLEDGTAYVDTLLLGRVQLFSGDYVTYDAEWRPIGVIRRSVMESMS